MTLLRSCDRNQFLREKELWTGNCVYFKNPVHPNRWQSIFGAPYLLLKALVQRLDDEARFYRAEMERLEKLDLQLPEGEKAVYVPAEEVGETKKIFVDSLEVIFDISPFTGSYTPVEESQEGLVKAYRSRKSLIYTLKPACQFVIRADEYAYFKHGLGKIASWLDERQWREWKESERARIVWQQMVLSNQCALRYRVKENITQHVSAT